MKNEITFNVVLVTLNFLLKGQNCTIARKVTRQIAKLYLNCIRGCRRRKGRLGISVCSDAIWGVSIRP